MIKHFCFVWIAYWISFLILPISSIYSSIYSAFLLQFAFFLLVLIGYSWFWLASNRNKSPEWGRHVPQNIRRAIRFSLFISIIGTLCILYDKMVVQGVDYSQGIAIAREQWRKEGVQREGGISSIFSVLGYLLSSGYFVAAVLLASGGVVFERSFIYKSIILIFILLMINSVLTGGRTNILLMTVFIAGSVTSVSGWSYKIFLRGKIVRLSVFVFLLFSFIYLLYVFSERANATGVNVGLYVENFLPYLGLESSSWFVAATGVDGWSALMNLLVLAASYITHSISTTAAIIDHGPGDKVILFLHPMNILYKLSLVERPDSSWFLSGRFPSLPGALLYQFGALGFFVMSLLIGFLSALSKFLFLSAPSNLIILSIYLMMYGVLVVSPLLLIVDIMSFPFVMSSFVMVSVYCGIVKILSRSTKG